MNVMKFGGAALHNADGIRRMAEIVASGAPRPLIVVVSAIHTTTRELEHAARLASAGHLPNAEGVLSDIEARYTDVLNGLDIPDTQRSELRTSLISVSEELHHLMSSLALTRQLSLRTLDRILAFGEDCARMIVAAALTAHGMDVIQVDARDLIVTDDAFGSALPNAEKSRLRVQEYLVTNGNHSSVIVTQGFVGQTEDGNTTTMGKESSNLTATFLGSLIGSTEITFWTDVEGIRSADPHLVPDSRLREALSYTQARHAASEGLKLIYPTMIVPAEAAGIQLRFASINNPQGGSTVIDAHDHSGTPVITVHRDAMGDAVTVLFAPFTQWIHAISSLSEQVQESQIQNLHYAPEHQAATIVVNPSVTTTTVQHLHTLLCT